MAKDRQMGTARKTFGKIFKDEIPVQWIIPRYQRKYVWKSDADEQILGMWEDWKNQTEKLLNPDPENPIRPHYFGAIIYYLHNETPKDTVRKRDLVDGQQRLTTFQIALVALRDVGMELEYENATNIDIYIHKNPASSKETEDFILLPSRNDCERFQEIIATNKDKEILKGDSAIIKAYNCFYKEIKEFVEGNSSEEKTVKILIEKLKKALLDHFQAVLIQLGDHDDPQQIFASLNGKGEPLTAFDLVRNDIFYRADKEGEKLASKFENNWAENFEIDFWRDIEGHGRAKKTHANHFIMDVVIAQTAQMVKQNKIFTDYKNHVKGHFASVADELDVLIKYGQTYRALQDETGTDTNRIAKMLNLWDSTTMNSLVMWIDTRQKLDSKEKSDLFLLIESYIVRREICKLSANAFNRIVPEILTDMHEAEKHGQSIIGAFKNFLETRKTSTRKIPTDNEIITACEQKNIYTKTGSKKLVYILEHIEQHITSNKSEKLIIDTNDLNIEHIMPQKWSVNWPLKNGNKVFHEEYLMLRDEKGQQLDENTRNLMEERQSLINTIGNLTIMTAPLNSAISNNSWEVKKLEIKNVSKLKLNRDIIKKAEWNEDVIKKRSKDLGDYINEIWKHPSTK